MSALVESLPKTSNRILNALTRSEYECLVPHLDHVNLSAGEILCHPEQAITHVYFPNRGIVSVVSVFENGGTVEVGMVGNEGMFGVCAFLGSVATPLQAVVQLPGDALMMRVGVLKKEFDRCGQLQDLLLRYTQAFITQIAQTAACNSAHHIDGRLARWLLMCHDRSRSKEMEMTQDRIAYMLGTRRASVTVAAGQLRQEGLISYSRGHLTINNRAGLEARSCECYEIVKREFDHLVGGNGHAVYGGDLY